VTTRPAHARCASTRRAGVYAAWAALLVGTRVADTWLTYRLTPDVARELNPLVRYLGMGWVALLLGNALLVAVLLYLLYRSLYRRPPPVPRCADTTLAEYRRRYVEARGAFAHVISYVLPRGGALWGLVPVVHNVLVWLQVGPYAGIRRGWNPVPYYYLLVPVLGVLLVRRLVAHEYARATIHAQESEGDSGDAE
jgi:hypothetical protein